MSFLAFLRRAVPLLWDMHPSFSGALRSLALIMVVSALGGWGYTSYLAWCGVAGLGAACSWIILMALVVFPIVWVLVDRVVGSTEAKMESNEEDDLREVREALGDRGTPTTTLCGCEWRMMGRDRLVLRGVTISGDILVRRCEYHLWYSRQSAEVQRQLSRQERARGRGEENRS